MKIVDAAREKPKPAYPMLHELPIGTLFRFAGFPDSRIVFMKLDKQRCAVLGSERGNAAVGCVRQIVYSAQGDISTPVIPIQAELHVTNWGE